jgi:hypothetical protein
VLGIAPGLNVKVGLPAGYGRTLDRNVFRLPRHILEGIKYFLVYQIALLDPALLSALEPNPRKAPFPLEHFDPIPVFCGSHLAVELRQLVAKRYLGRGNVIDFEHTLAMPPAGTDDERRE